MSAPRTPRRWRLSRRGFLIGMGLTGGGLALGFRLALPELQLMLSEWAERTDASTGAPFAMTPNDPFAWFEIGIDGAVRLFLTKVEMGQGVMTSLTQLAAEELRLAPERIQVQQAPTSRFRNPDLFGTAGSTSVLTLFTPLRQAAATLREMLREEAAIRLSVPAEQVEIADGTAFVRANPAQRLPFGELVRGKRQWEAPREPAPLTPPSAWRYIGQPVPRLDLRDKVTGRAIYGYDARTPGMLYGAVLHPPTLEGRLQRVVSTARAQQTAGVEQVVVDGSFVGVVAHTRAAAWQAASQIEAEWDFGKRWEQDEIDRIVTVGGPGGVTIQRVGDAPALLQGEDIIAAEYRTPFAIQTPLEAQAALADARADRATIWVSTQAPFLMQQQVALALGMRPDQVEIIPLMVGGGFGRKSFNPEIAIEAARLSRAAGAPVHVAWTRQEELQLGFLRPPTHHRLRGRLEGGRIVALEHQQASGDVLFAFAPGIAKQIIGNDFGATRGATIRYAIPHRRVVAWRRDLPVRTGPWRGLGLLANTFAVESFMDMLARTAGVDPLEFRLAHLPEDPWGKRMAAVLRAAAESAGWGEPLPAGRARGIACSTDVNTVVAQVAEVSLEEGERIRVHRITLAMDCGLVINPDGVKAQAEGGVMWGVGSALLEEARVSDGRIAALNFDAYPILSLDRAPEVNVILLNTLNELHPHGVGEPPMGPTAAAIANAFFALTGRTLHQMPFTPQRVSESSRRAGEREGRED